MSEERFLHWQVAFPGLWSDWEAKDRPGGFDAVIGNPPWDRVKLQQVEWFAARREAVAKAQRAAERKAMVKALEQAGDPLAAAYAHAAERARTTARMARSCGDYPLLSGGDVNLYSLFVERAMALVKPQGMVGLLVPIGISTDRTSARFFSSLVTEKRIKCFYAFENRQGWLFPDIHHEEQPSVIVFNYLSKQSDYFDFCARVSSWKQFDETERRFSLNSDMLTRMNPNTITIPILRSRRDAELVMGIYQRFPILVNRSTGQEVKAWPVKYFTMFHMTKDSRLFRTKEELEEQEGAFLVGGNHWDSPNGIWMPLYEGKSIQLFNHRYANIRVNPNNISGQGVSEPLSSAKLSDPVAVPIPRYWVSHASVPLNRLRLRWAIGFNDISNTNNERSLITALVPSVAFGNTLPILMLSDLTNSKRIELLVGNLGSIICDYTARQKIQSRHLSKYIIEQLPVIPPDHYTTAHFGPKTAAEIVQAAVLELTYTAHDMAPFARDMGHVDEAGAVLPPFPWDETRRLHLRAKLDALFFHLYGITNRDDVRYIYSTFPIVERQDQDTYGCYRSRDLCLAYMNALAAGQPDVVVEG